ncbi:MAG TPA: LuxR C-terminal-related transcriptional regulator [Lacunisphaera sp.]
MARDPHDSGTQGARSRRGGVVKLSPAEAAVVAELARGLTNGEIARALDKSPGTVKNQLGNVYRKLGVKNRIRLMMMFRP